MQIFSVAEGNFFNLQLRSWWEETEKKKQETEKNKGKKKREGKKGGKKNRGRNLLGGALDPLEPIEASR